MSSLMDPIKGVRHHEVGGLEIDTLRAGNGRLKRTVYPPGWRWSTHMQPVSGTPYCMHTHLGFLAQGRIVGDEPAVFISWDSEEGTARRFGLPERHDHG